MQQPTIRDASNKHKRTTESFQQMHESKIIKLSIWKTNQPLQNILTLDARRQWDNFRIRAMGQTTVMVVNVAKIEKCLAWWCWHLTSKSLSRQ